MNTKGKPSGFVQRFKNKGAMLFDFAGLGIPNCIAAKNAFAFDGGKGTDFPCPFVNIPENIFMNRKETGKIKGTVRDDAIYII